MLVWCSGYHVCLTRSRSRVRIISLKKEKKETPLPVKKEKFWKKRGERRGKARGSSTKRGFI